MTTATIDRATRPTPTAGAAHPIRRAALASGSVAAVATTAVAAAADAAGISSFEIDGEVIPLLGFAQMTLVGAVVGGLLAAALRRWSSASASASAARRFFAVAAVLTALSCVPSVTMPDDAATKIVLVATHVLAAAIIVPALARQIRR